ncbi:MAG: hypothetical protein IPM97_08400 [Bdellovibrionaceae bacterium]|nr:hypothetical protein [Pseudobdellovibrionaceae bacterium]
MLRAFLVFIALSSQIALANPYAPTLKSVVALYDIADREYSPFLFHLILDVTLDMRMDESCRKISVTKDAQVLCFSNGASTVVGTLGEKVNQDGFWSAYRIEWASNVEIVETQEEGRFTYAVRLK